MPIELKITNTREFTCPVPATQQDTSTLATALQEAAEAGFNITQANTLLGGSQRDPYVIGFKITVGKP